MNENLVFEKLTQVLAANGNWQTSISGNTFRIASSAYPVTITLLKNNQIIGSMSNMLAGDYVENAQFDAVIVKNGAASQAVTIQISAGGTGSDRVIGEVSIIDGGKFRTIADNAFLGNGLSIAVAGQNSYVQLFNPSNSGKRALLKAYSLSSDVGSAGSLFRLNSPLTTLYKNPQSKKTNGVASVMEIRIQNSLTNLNNPNTSYLSNYFPNLSTNTVNFNEPISLEPNTGIVLTASGVNANLYANFEYFEELI